MVFSLLSWNVEKFKGQTAQLQEVSKHIENLNPDIFGLFEVENVDILDLIINHLPSYDYFLTDGPQNKEILVGVRKNKFGQVTFTQKREFKAYNPYLRPGALLTISIDTKLYNILFLHTDSGTEGRDFGNRFQMFEKIWSLKKAIDKKADKLEIESKLIVMGDLNTMGLFFPTRHKYNQRIEDQEEIDALRNSAERVSMEFLPKEFSHTWTDLKKFSELDHVLASSNIQFKTLGQQDGESFSVKVTGWQQLSGIDRENFVNSISDHCSLYTEIL